MPKTLTSLVNNKLKYNMSLLLFKIKITFVRGFIDEHCKTDLRHVINLIICLDFSVCNRERRAELSPLTVMIFNQKLL